MKRPSRRRLLVAAGASAASFSLAGCSSDSDGDGTEPEDPTTTTEETATESTTADGADTDGSGEPVGSDRLRGWLPVADAFAFDLQATVMYDADLAAIADRQDDFYSGTYDRIGQTLLGPRLASIVPAESRERVVQHASAFTVVLRTTMSADELGSSLTDAGLSEAGSEDDATLYEGDLDGVASASAVVGSTVVQSFGENASSSVSAVLGARSGETARLVPNNSEVRTVADAVGDSELLVVTERGEDTPSGDPSLDGATALGYSWQFGADSTDLTLGITYEGDGDGDPSAVASYFGGQNGFSDYEALEGSAEGRVVILRGTIATNEFDLLAPGTPGESSGTEPPQTQFSFEFDSAGESLTVTHDGGDTVQAANLSLRLGSERADSQFVDEYEEVSAGDSITVDVSGVDSGTQVVLIWSDGESGAVLGQTQVP